MNGNAYDGVGADARIVADDAELSKGFSSYFESFLPAFWVGDISLYDPD